MGKSSHSAMQHTRSSPEYSGRLGSGGRLHAMTVPLGAKSPLQSSTRPFSHQSAARRSEKQFSQASKSHSWHSQAAMLPVAMMDMWHTLQEQCG